MSNPKDKAKELYNKYEQLGKDFTRGVSMAEFAKECALIAQTILLQKLKDLNIEDSFEEQVLFEINVL